MNPMSVEQQTNLVPKAVRFALLGGAVAAAADPSIALAQSSDDVELEEIVITGTRIRRVDAETASPVQVVGAEEIKESGASTIGELLQKLPMIGGAATNPAVNNGGGDGASNIELRGLGVERTLVLLNGRRYGALGDSSSAIDVNSIPVNMLERVEVLKQGAGAIYGSDAIGGVVNFITRTDMDGGEVSLDYGTSSRKDGDRKGISLTYGNTGDRGSLILGVNYNQQDSISAGERAFSRNAIYFYGSVFEGGSSRVPTGRIYVEDTPLETTYGCASVTRRAGTAGASLGDYRCYLATGTPNDAYNYQPENLILTPQDRVSMFTLGSLDVNDNVELYTELLYNYTKSAYKIAPLPFDSRSDDIVISEDNMYNPFGLSFGGADGVNNLATWRMLALGNRAQSTTTYQGHMVFGTRGDIMNTGWAYDVNVGYSRLDQEKTTEGYLFSSRLRNALGPSFMDGDTPTCGTPGAPIANCIPLNIFNLEDPAQADALSQIAAGYNQSYEYATRHFNAGVTGDLIELPAGMLQVAGGFEWRGQQSKFDTDFLTEAAPPDFLNCLLGQEPCSGDRAGKFIAREVYGELFVPLMADRPGVEALNLTLGARHSDFSTYGSSTNFTAQLEYRPVGDVLLRGSYADVFRAPTLLDLYQAPTADAPTFTDPCIGLTAADVAANPNLALACVDVPTDGTFDQPNSQITGVRIGNADLDAEDGEALTFGLVYDPSWLPGASLTLDYWQYKINNLIQLADVNTSASVCVETGDPFFCGLHQRFDDGTTRVFYEPRVNLGSLKTAGVDVNLSYAWSTETAGNFRASLDATFTDKYDNNPGAGAETVHVAGYYDRQYGNIAKTRLSPQLSWNMAGFTGRVAARYIGKLKLTDPDAAPGIQDDLKIKAFTYLDASVGYELPVVGTKLLVGVNNLTDKQPPILYQNNVTNANTDVETYDTIGRYFFVNLTQRF